MTDEDFRARFFVNPAAATWQAGLELSPVELEAVSALSRAGVTRLGRTLDPPAAMPPPEVEVAPVSAAAWSGSPKSKNKAGARP